MITVILPTYNRCNNIIEILNNSFSLYSGSLFQFKIYDSSSDSKTEDAYIHFVKQNDKEANKKIEYISCDQTLNGDEKIKIAINECNTEYFYLMGDRLLVDFNELELSLKANSFFDYCAIGVFPDTRRGHMGIDHSAKLGEIYRYEDGELFFCRYFSYLTKWGASIIRTEAVQKMIRCGQMVKYGNTSWWITSCLAEIIGEKNSNNMYGILYTQSICNNSFDSGHSWAVGEKYYKIAFRGLNETVDLLPAMFERHREELIKQIRTDSIATRKFVLRQRAKGNVNYKLTKKYKVDIERIPFDYEYMIIISLLPIPIFIIPIKMINLIKYFSKKQKQ